MTKVYLISPARLKEASELHSNVDDKYIKVAIQSAQDMEIEQILGTELMDKIKSLMPTTINDTGNAKYKTLLHDYIEDALIYYTLEHVMDTISIKLLNKGAMTREAEQAVPLGENARDNYKREYHRKGDFYADRLMRYLIVHQSDYSEYMGNNTTMDKTKPKKTTFSTGFYLGDSDTDYKRNNGNPKNW